jgi:multimeric flavodoxin WrbA
MACRIMFVCGSPNRRGNTNRVVEWVADAARGAGADVEIVNAAELDYKTTGCIACMACQRNRDFRCAIDDEASQVIARMSEADAVVFASPVYWHGPSAQLKLLLDRMFSLVDFSRMPFRTALEGRTLAVIGTGGGPMEDGLDMLEMTFHRAADALDLPFDSLLVPLAPQDPADMEQKADVREKAVALGRKLAGGQD